MYFRCFLKKENISTFFTRTVPIIFSLLVMQVNPQRMTGFKYSSIICVKLPRLKKSLEVICILFFFFISASGFTATPFDTGWISELVESVHVPFFAQHYLGTSSCTISNQRKWSILSLSTFSPPTFILLLLFFAPYFFFLLFLWEKLLSAFSPFWSISEPE